MKKLLAILAIALFLGGISAPVVAASTDAQAQITMTKEEPKKKEKKADAKKSSGCEESCSKKKSACNKEKGDS